ncbi:MAG: ATPase, T2SS/T4P/T4SS family [Candidatus Paracaedibacteraceae bacterium]|nr:ATPase, T2SS/T4P/T4SS family [Candidatus Paracaedibacteraceae bacterium]
MQSVSSYQEQHLANALLSKEYITIDQLNVAISEQKINNQSLEAVLVDMGYLCPMLLQRLKSENSGLPFVDLRSLDPKKKGTTGFLPKDICYNLKAYPFYVNNEQSFIAMQDPEDVKATDALLQYINLYHPTVQDIQFYHADVKQIDFYLKNLYPQETIDRTDEPLSILEHIIDTAVSHDASDIHFQPDEKDIGVRFRIDGVLEVACVIHPTKWSQIINRLKVCANLDIAESRRPQSGHFLKSIKGNDIDIRVSTHPTLYGENVVLRLLNKEKRVLTLDELGFPKIIATELRRITKAPQGLIVLTGPTGAGKTTTLYALLSTIDAMQRNIMTLEAPIESVLPGVRQTEIRDNSMLTYSDGIRSLLRQDPDVILIGEIRDEETASMALRAVLTGHLVLSTLHTQDVLGVPGRLIDLGLSTVLLAGTLQAVIAQRLVRRLCQVCFGDFKSETECPNCVKGYKGRTIVMEYLTFDEEFNDVITKGGDRSDLARLRREIQFPTLWDHGMQLVNDRVTTMEELTRVLGSPRTK